MSVNGSPEFRESIATVPAKYWHAPLAALFFVVLITLILFRDTAWSMVSIWARSDTFAHGFLILPISLWLIWRNRHVLAMFLPRASFWPLPLMAFAGFMWLLSEMAAVNVVSQFALVSILVLAVPATLGTRLTWKMAFPLGFLFFAVPFGEFTMPLLMEWTAKMTVLGLRWSGVPVYQEGLRFVIPTGSWSVVEACSGVRYLIASLVVGTLFAYLNYRSLKRRLIFVGVSFVVPIIANWIRAYMIVMLGHLSGNTLAAGVDHLIYGWVFFGGVIMALFWIGARWSEDTSVEETPSMNTTAVGDVPGRNSLLAMLAAVVIVSLGPLAERWIERWNASADTVVIQKIEPTSGWEKSSDSLADLTPYFENASASAKNTFTKNGRVVGLYIAYYRNQGDGRRMISSSNTLATSQDNNWALTASGSREISMGGEPLKVRSAELLGASSLRLMVWQWYWVNGRLTSSDHLAKVYAAFYRLLGKGDDSAVIFAYAPVESPGATERILQDFVETQGPAISQALQRTRKAGE